MEADLIPDDHRSVWMIYLKNSEGDHVDGNARQEGFISANGLLFGSLSVCKEPAGAAQFPTEQRAEEELMRLEEEFGLNREHAKIAPYILDKSFVLTLGDDDHDDGIAVLHEDGKYFIQPHHYGWEPSDEIAPEVAEVLISVLWKIQNRLKRRS